MSAFEELYSALGSDVLAISVPLFELGEEQLVKFGGIEPRGAGLDASGRLGMITERSHRATDTSADVRERVYESLPQIAAMESIVAVAAVEWVRISVGRHIDQPSIKVAIHHRRGLAVTLYEPATWHAGEGWEFGDVIARAGEPLIATWPVVSSR
jgi:hypothetical protein